MIIARLSFDGIAELYLAESGYKMHKMKFHYYQVTDERVELILNVAMRIHGIIDFDYADCVAALTNKYGDNFTACDDYTLAERVEDYLKCKLSYN